MKCSPLTLLSRYHRFRCFCSYIHSFQHLLLAPTPFQPSFTCNFLFQFRTFSTNFCCCWNLQSSSPNIWMWFSIFGTELLCCIWFFHLFSFSNIFFPFIYWNCTRWFRRACVPCMSLLKEFKVSWFSVFFDCDMWLIRKAEGKY